MSFPLFRTTGVDAIVISITKYPNLCLHIISKYQTRIIFKCFELTYTGILWKMKVLFYRGLTSFFLIIALRRKYVIGNFSKKLVSEKSCPNFELLFFNVAQTR